MQLLDHVYIASYSKHFDEIKFILRFDVETATRWNVRKL